MWSAYQQSLSLALSQQGNNNLEKKNDVVQIPLIPSQLSNMVPNMFDLRGIEKKSENK